MSLFDKGAKHVWLGIGIGSAAVLAAPYVLPLVSSVGRPLVKGLLLQGVLAFERGREALAHLAETLDDIIAEVRAEAEADLAARGAARRANEGSTAHPASGNTAKTSTHEGV